MRTPLTLQTDFADDGDNENQPLAGRVEVAVNQRAWSYALHNDESLDSPNFISSFGFDLKGSATVSGTPDGWAVLTDNQSYVLWYATEQEAPYPHDIAPGTSLNQTL